MEFNAYISHAQMCRRVDESEAITFRPETRYFPPSQGYLSVCAHTSVYTRHPGLMILHNI